MEFVIEKGVKIAGNKYAKAEAVIEKLEIGDSFVFPSPSSPSPLYGFAVKIGMKVKAKRISEGQYRIWRVA